MAKLPTPKKKRTHLPALPPDKLARTLEKLETLPLSKEAKKAVADSLKAAANPAGESIQVVMKTIEKPRRKMIEKTARQLRAFNDEIMARGKARLDGLSDDEWNDLIERSN